MQYYLRTPIHMNNLGCNIQSVAKIIATNIKQKHEYLKVNSRLMGLLIFTIFIRSIAYIFTLSNINQKVNNISYTPISKRK